MNLGEKTLFLSILATSGPKIMWTLMIFWYEEAAISYSFKIFYDNTSNLKKMCLNLFVKCNEL